MTFMMYRYGNVNESFVYVCEGEEGKEWKNTVLSYTCACSS